MEDGAPDQETRHALVVVQNMIDVSAEHLKGLRTQCATSAELTQQEIRTLEGKLIKLFSRQLVAKSRAPEELKNVPSLEQWLQVVGLSPQVVQGICHRVGSLEALEEKSDHELRVILIERNAGEEDLRRLTRALHNLKRYTVLPDLVILESLNANNFYRAEEIKLRPATILKLSPRSSNLLLDTKVLLRGDKSGESGEFDLFWDSWDRQHASGASTSPRPPRTRLGRCSVPSEDFLPLSSLAGAGSATTLATASSVGSINSLPQLSGTPIHLAPSSPPVQGTFTPPSTPPIFKTKCGDRNKFPTTPPPRKKHQTGIQQPSPQEQVEHDLAHIIAENQQGFLPKSRSHEFQLGGDGLPLGAGSSGPGGPRPARRERLPTEPGPNCNSDFVPTSPLLSSPIKSPPFNSKGSDGDAVSRPNLQVPKSPHMGHQINHRFAKAYTMITVCDYCDRQMFIGTGLRCKECKFKCHRDCEPKVPPACGLPKEFITTFRRALNTDGSKQSPGSGRPSPSHVSSNLRRKERKRLQQIPLSIAPYPGPVSGPVCGPGSGPGSGPGPDSSSNTSSCNSSTPSSPALVGTFQQGSQPHASSATATTKQQQFHFPDVVPSGGSTRSGSSRGITLEPHPLTAPPAPPALEELLDSRKSGGHSLDSDKTVSVSGSGSVSTDSERTPVRVDSQDSQVSDGEAVDGRGWPRQNSLSMREWDIPYDELKIGDRIGTGHFGTVYRGNWHGDVAIKMLSMSSPDGDKIFNMSYPDGEKILEAFKTEVATLRKTRHENLMLFMGACMKPPNLAIVTSLCKGLTLYTHIHLRKDKFNMNRTTGIAQQICQGMGYLHARGIIHKDLKSKNIFLENGKVVITDFGLFSVTKLCFGNKKGDGLSIPPGWLCYLAPEVICSLKGHQKHDDEELPFSKASDVYAFGTVWYELLCGEWPFKAQPPESIIWQVGKGMKQPLANLQASQDVKNILMMCWSFETANRPDFARLLKTLEKVPRRRLARSPSHPIHLSRSAESVF